MLTDRVGDEELRRPPPWAAPPAAVDEAARSVVRGVVLRVLGAGFVAWLLLSFGHARAAVVLLTVLTVSSVASVLLPATGRFIDRFMAGFQQLVGRLLTWVLLGAVWVLVFVPAAVVLRVLRRDPLALGARPDDATFWRDAPRRRKPLHNRPFTYERHPVLRPRRRSRVTAVLAAAALVLLDLGAGASIDAARQTSASPGASALVAMPDVGAREGEPWAAELFTELRDHYARTEYHPYRGWTMADHRGEHVSVSDEVRRSYEAPIAAAGDAVEVFFFGGSTMMGWYQRDEHTIPSEFVRLAEADGIPVRAVNFGQPAYQNWQELLLLQEQLAAGRVPDLAVFYDGANEIATQFRAGPTTELTHIQAAEVEARLEAAAETGPPERSALRRLAAAYADTSAVAEALDRGGEAPPSPDLWAPWPDQSDRPGQRGEAAVEVHARGVELATKLSSGYGFRSAFFWQPWIYSKDAVPGEDAARTSWANDPEAWTAASDAAVVRIDEPVVDLSDSLDGVADPLMYDFVHSNEAGARRVAEALYRHLRPTLLELHRDGGR